MAHTPTPPKGQNIETMKLSTPAKPVVHRHGKPTGNAQTGVVEIVNFGDEPIGARSISRDAVSAFKGHAGDRNQSARGDSGKGI